MTIVSVVSWADSGSHRIEMRVEKRHAETGASELVMVNREIGSEGYFL
jgi:hypothetical protein